MGVYEEHLNKQDMEASLHEEKLSVGNRSASDGLIGNKKLALKEYKCVWHMRLGKRAFAKTYLLRRTQGNDQLFLQMLLYFSCHYWESSCLKNKILIMKRVGLRVGKLRF